MWEGSSGHLLLLEACTAVEACCLAHGHTNTGTGSNAASCPTLCHWPSNRICLSDLDCAFSETLFSSATKYRQLLHELYAQLFISAVKEEEMGLTCLSPLFPAPSICAIAWSLQKYKSEEELITEVEYCYQYYPDLMSDILLRLAFKWLFSDQLILQVLNYFRPLHSPPQNYN